MIETTSSNKLVAIWPVDKKFASITWQVSDVCNFKCSYCNPGNYGANNKNLDIDNYIKNLDKIINNFKNDGYESFRFFFSGGEPTIWQPLIPIVEFIRSKIEQPLIAINTNLSMPLEWWEENYYLFNDIVASFHIEFSNKEKYLSNMKFLQDKMDYLVCRMLMHDQRFQEVVDFSETLKNELDNYTIEYAALIEELRPHAGMYYYEDSWKRDFLTKNNLIEKKTLKKSGKVPKASLSCCVEYDDKMNKRNHNSNRLVSEALNNFKNWNCWVNDAIFIAPNGEVKTASCKLGKVLGNIGEEVNLSENKAVICNQERCNCGTDIGIRKSVKGFEEEKINIL